MLDSSSEDLKPSKSWHGLEGKQSLVVLGKERRGSFHFSVHSQAPEVQPDESEHLILDISVWLIH